MIPTHRNTLFNRQKDMNVWTDCCVRVSISASLLWGPLRFRRLVELVHTSSCITWILHGVKFKDVAMFCTNNTFYLLSEIWPQTAILFFSRTVRQHTEPEKPSKC